ncbi:MAG: hypothetical protein AAGD96_24305 [Chloroflexota bacterium]
MQQKRKNRIINILIAGTITALVLAVAVGVSASSYQNALTQAESDLEAAQATATWAVYDLSVQEVVSEQLQQQIDAQSTQLDQLEDALDVLVTREAIFTTQIGEANDEIQALNSQNTVLRAAVGDLENNLTILLTREAEFVEQIESINRGE